jgi:hypothetical protein
MHAAALVALNVRALDRLKIISMSGATQSFVSVKAISLESPLSATGS